MPLPWKKARVSRISRLVADLQPPNRGNSLVVQTGFPTSLVDLFVKNRDLLKKPSKKKKKQQHQQQCVIEEEIVISDPIALSNSRDLDVSSGPVCVIDRVQKVNLLSQQQRKSLEICNETVSDDQKSSNLFRQTIVEECVTTLVDGKNGCGENERSAFLAVLKMFVVVILALSSTKLAVGITVSAFALIFLEYIGNYFCFLKPCSNARMVLRSFLQRGFSMFHVRRDVLISEQESKCQDKRKVLVIQEEGTNVTDHKFDSCDLVESLQSDCHSEEIQVVESIDMDGAGVEGNRRMEIEFDLLNCEKRWGFLDAGPNARASNVRHEEVDESKKGGSVWERETSRRAKIKTKIKKLVPKRLRTGRKTGKGGKETVERESDSETSSYLGEDKNSTAMEEQETCGKVMLEQLLEEDDERYYGMLRKQELDQGISTPKSFFTVGKADNERKWKQELDLANCLTSRVSYTDSEKKQKQELDGRICTPRSVCNAKSETNSAMAAVEEERVEIERKGNAGYLILFLIVLAGLSGGRMLAIVLTFASVFMIKLLGSHRKCVISR